MGNSDEVELIGLFYLIFKLRMSFKTAVPRFDRKIGFTTSDKKSSQMRTVKSSDTKAEIKLRSALWRLGIRFRKNLKKLPGSPDIVLLSAKIAIFVDGEFWHGYNWAANKSKIKSNQAYWISKIERNIELDKENNVALQRLGFIVLRFWKKEIKNNLPTCLIFTMKIINQQRASMRI